MNQYIITEELLQEAMENTTWGRTNQQKFRDKLVPYQSEHQCPHWLVGRSATIDGDIDVWFCDKKSERDKVLDELKEKATLKKVYHVYDDHLRGLTFYVKLDDIYKVIEELRQAGR